jgi:hypothetical protein
MNLAYMRFKERPSGSRSGRGARSESVVLDDADISVLVRRGEARDDLHGDSPSLCAIACKRDFKLDLVTGTEDAAITAVTLGEVNESLNVSRRMHFQFHQGSKVERLRCQTRYQLRSVCRRAAYPAAVGIPPADLGDRRLEGVV